jgi:tRNA(Ile)-lysidine synthase
MAARAARYAFLVRTARRVKADVIVTAHTADDQAETVLLKLVRGAGRTGLAGIPFETVMQGCRIVRPILDCTRAEVLAYLRKAKVAWREDESNADRSFLRNRVRHELLPLLGREFNPRIREALSRTSRVFAAEDEWLDGLAAAMLRDCQEGACDTAGETGSRASGKAGPAILCDRLRRLPLAARRRVIRCWLIDHRVPESCLDLETVDRVVAAGERTRGSRRLLLGEGRIVRQSYGRLYCERTESPGTAAFRATLRIPGTTVLRKQGLRIVVRLAPGLVRERPLRPGNWPARASLSAEAWARQAVEVRSREAGDRMEPWGLSGSKKVQDILVDQKVPRAERSRVPVFECGGTIVWLPGYRVARAWAVTDPEAVNLQISVDELGS